MKKVLGTLLAVSVFVPLMAFAQSTPDNFGEIGGFFQKIIGFINNTLIPLVFAIALLMFIWGVFQYMILGGADGEKREQGQQLMIWAIIGFVVMVSVWGIVNLISSGLGFKGTQNIQQIPNVPSTRGTGSGL